MKELFTKEQVRAWLKENDLKDVKSIEDAFVDQIKDVLQEALETEMTHQIGYSKYDWKNKETENSRNGHTKKTVKSRFGEIDLQIPRDNDAEFEPTIVKKHERMLSDSTEDKITSMYARGMSTRDIDSQIRSIYGYGVSSEMVTTITNKIIPIAKEWQNRPLKPIYPILYLDGIMFNVNQDAHITNKTVYLVYGITIEGKKEILGIWIGEAESAKFWMGVVADLRNRGVKDILIACVDGLKGFKEAIKSTFQQTEIQKCIVHQIRNCTKFVNYKDRKAFCADMREMYTAPNEEAGLAALQRFEDKWGGRYGYAIKSWKENWPELSTFFKYPPEIRRMIYTTNIIENFNRRIRQRTKNKSSFPTDESLFKMLYLIVIDASEKWTMPVQNWGIIINQMRVYFGERVDKYL